MNRGARVQRHDDISPGPCCTSVVMHLLGSYDSPYVQERPAHPSAQDVGLSSRGCPFGHRDFYGKNRRWSRVTASGDVKPSTGWG